MSLQSVILECVEITRKPKWTDKKYFLEVARKIDKGTDDEFEAMPEEVRKWMETVVDRAEAGEDFPIPSDEEIEDPKGEEEKPKKSKKDKKSKKSKKDKKNKKDKKSKKNKEEVNIKSEPEPEKEKPETKPKKVDKKKPDKKGKDMAKAAKKDKKADKKADKKVDKKADKKADKKTNKRGERQPALDPTARIELIVKKNPRREGTSVHANYAIYKTGMTVKKYLEKGGIAGCLRTDIKRENIRLITK